MRALALEQLHSNPVGVYGDVLLGRGIEINRVRLDLGEALPDWREYDLLVVMGGGMSVYEEDAYPWLVAEKRAIREAVTTGCPYFGVLLGIPAAGDRARLARVPRAGARAGRQSDLPLRGRPPRPGLQGLPARRRGVRVALRHIRFTRGRGAPRPLLTLRKPGVPCRADRVCDPVPSGALARRRP